VTEKSTRVKECGKPSGRRLKGAFALALAVLLTLSLIASTQPAFIPRVPSASAELNSLELPTNGPTQDHSRGASLPEALATLKGGQLAWQRGGLSNQTIAHARLYNLTLITGDSVLARVAENGTILSIAVSPADPTKLGQEFLILKMRNSTYVIPSSVDPRKYDLELFDIDLLIKEGYGELPHIPVIVQHSTDVSALIGQVKARRGEVTRSFSITPAIAIRLPKDRAGSINELLASSRDIRRVWLDRKVHPNLDESAPLIGAPDAWTLGLNGSGVRIAIIDTGIDASHPDFYFPNGTSKIERAVSFVDYDGDGVPDEPPNDYFGHGTHVASIAAGTGAKSSGRFKGIAYGAKLWNVKVLNREGWGYLSWVIAGVEYAALGPDHMPNTGDEADILSLSLGTYWWTDGTDPLSMACDAAVDAGRVVVVAAGNWGGYFYIGVPATARKVITVGATDKQDKLAWFSSCGPTIDYRVKPDIVAPGVDIWAALARGSYIEYWANQSWIPAIDVDGDGRYDYVRLSGTSMSTPHVSGAAALLKQLSPHLTPNEIKNILISTAKDLGYNAYQQGGGRVNITSAISTPVLVDPATISLGAITEDKLVNTTITFAFRPLLRIRPLTNITLSLEATVREIFTGSVVNAARLNTTVITIPFNESRAVLLTINTTLPKSIYEGRVTAKVVGGPWGNRTVHAILGFARLNNLTINMIDRKGFPAAYRPVLFFQHNAPYYLWGYNFWFTYTDWNGVVRAYVPDGEFYVIGHDWDYSVQATVWMIADRAPIYGNTVIILDERSAGEVNFDPAKPNQVFAAKRSSISYSRWFIQLTDLWYYPSTALTYMTSTTLGVSFGYEYYNKDYFNVACPDVIDAPEWHNLIYWQSGIAPPVTYVANYSSLVKRVTEYKVSMTPKLAAWLVQHKQSPLEWSSWEIGWVMNVPRARVEWLTPDVYYHTYYEKFRDPPWTSTPYWFFAYWPLLKERYPPGEVHEVFGGHPLTTHFLVLAGSDWLDMISDLHMDTYGHTLWTDVGHVWIYRNDTLIVDSDVWDYFWYSWYNDPRPSKYRVEIEGRSGLWLSNYTYAKLWFTVVNASLWYAPPSLYINVRDLDLNNTRPAGEVILDVYVNDPRASSEANVTVKFSVDDGATWRDAAPLERKAGGPYPFSLGKLANAYVSLWINATDKADSGISMKVIRGFYVSPRPAPDLIIKSMDYTPRPAFAGRTATLSVVVSNVGDVDAEAFNVSVFVNNSKVAEERVERLKVNEDAKLAFSWAPTTVGTYVIKVVVDPSNEVAESNEKNNEMEMTAEVFAPFHMFVTGLDGGVWHREFDGRKWGSWESLGGIALDGLSAAYFNGKLYVAVRGLDNSMWYGYVDVASKSFSGWINVPGLTPSKPTLVSTSSGVLMIVRDVDDGIWVYPVTWPNPSWIKLAGLTADAPAAVAVGDKVHIVVRGIDGYSLWHGVLDVSKWTFSGWTSIAGATDSTPDLCLDEASGVVYLAVKGIDGAVCINMYTESLGWHGWISIGGLTDQGPAIQIIDNSLMVLVKGAGSESLWINFKNLDGTWSGWKSIDGLTKYQPELIRV
jgi:subtilisin family serine protease